MVFPILETERLQLTEIAMADADAILQLFADPQVVRYYDLEAFTELDQAKKLIALFRSRYDEAAGIRWAIRLKGSNDLIGSCGFNSWNGKMRHATIGYDLKTSHWNCGYGSEAVKVIIRHAFAGKLACGPLHRIQADTVPGNNASEQLLRRLGFKEEGLRRECGYWKNAYHDLKCFGLLSAEFVAA